MTRRLLGCLLASLVASCTGRALTTPTDLPVRAYPADAPFTLTLVMTSCSSTCATYEAPDCRVVSAGADGIDLEVEVSYELTSDVCDLKCGPPVLAHCEVAALPAGRYAVRTDGFEREIVLGD